MAITTALKDSIRVQRRSKVRTHLTFLDRRIDINQADAEPAAAAPPPPAPVKETEEESLPTSSSQVTDTATGDTSSSRDPQGIAGDVDGSISDDDEVVEIPPPADTRQQKTRSELENELREWCGRIGRLKRKVSDLENLGEQERKRQRVSSCTYLTYVYEKLTVI